MIRLGLLWLYVLGLGIYAWKDWYVGLCGLILLVAVVQHPDMPKGIAGVQGLNPWNILFVCVVCGWLKNRKVEHLTWDMPTKVTWLLLAYLCAVAIATGRLIADHSAVSPNLTPIISEQVINTLKWPTVGMLLFLGCRSRLRFTMALTAILAVYFLVGVQVIRWMPASAVMAGDDLAARSLKILVNEVGYHRVNLSMMLAGAFWAMWAVSHAKIGWLSPRLLTIASFVTFYAQALTAGRMGYVTWLVLGFLLSVVRWRKYLVSAPVLVPLLIFIVVTFTPGAAERLLQGFTRDTVDTARPVDKQGRALAVAHEGPDMYTVTAGRTLAWSYVIDKIGESPIVGHGREAMVRTGLEAFLWNTYRESFPHPHNAYLELLLDNGAIGFCLVLPFYLVLIRYGIVLFKDSRSPVFMVTGGVACALIFALLIASWGSQTFYPREGSVGMWCAIGLLLRVYVERQRVLSAYQRLSPSMVSEVGLAGEHQPESLPIRRPGALLRPRKNPDQDPSAGRIDSMLWTPVA